MESPIDTAIRLLDEALEAFAFAKPNDKTPRDRLFAIVITQIEVALACAKQWLAE